MVKVFKHEEVDVIERAEFAALVARVACYSQTVTSYYSTVRAY